MKTMMFLITLLMGTFALAGGSGGGGVLASQPKELVFSYSPEGDFVRFAYGTKTTEGWKIEKVQMRSSELKSEIAAALEKSKVSKNWVSIGGH